VEWSNMLCVGDCMAGCIAYGGILKFNIFTLVRN
jgi:hypothetical protein